VELVRELKSRQYEVGAWDRAHADITDAAAVERALAGFDAEVVLNAAAYNQVDIAEKEPQAAFLVNALAVRNLALACRQIDARLVHFSTMGRPRARMSKKILRTLWALTPYPNSPARSTRRPISIRP